MARYIVNEKLIHWRQRGKFQTVVLLNFGCCCCSIWRSKVEVTVVKKSTEQSFFLALLQVAGTPHCAKLANCHVPLTLYLCTSGLQEADALGEMCVGVSGHFIIMDIHL